MLPMVDNMKYGRRLSVDRMFAPAFTLTCCLLFIVPSYVLMTIARNPVVTYFGTRSPYALVVIPVVIAWAHFHHTSTGVPSKRVISISFSVPSILLIIVGQTMFMEAERTTHRLMSDECSASGKKAHLQRSWEAAYNSFEGCINNTLSRPGSDVPLDKIYEYFRFPDCEEYAHAARASNYSSSWTYLRFLEEQEGCRGWCYPGQQIWSAAPAKDSCSMVVASAFKYLVQPHAREVALIQVFVLFFAAVSLVIVGPRLRERGYEW